MGGREVTAPEYAPGQQVLTVRGKPVIIARVDRSNPYAARYWIHGIDWPYKETELRPMPVVKDGPPPMTYSEFTRKETRA